MTHSLPAATNKMLQDLSDRLRDSGRYPGHESDLADATLIDEVLALISRPKPALGSSLESLVRLLKVDGGMAWASDRCKCSRCALMREIDTELDRLASANTMPASRTYVAVVEPHHDRMKIGDRVVMIELIYSALGMELPLCPHGHRYVENTCGPCSEGRPNRPLERTSDESDPCVSHMAMLEYEREITAILDGLGPRAVRVREGGGMENLLQSLAVTVSKLAGSAPTSKDESLLADVLAFLRQQREADVIAASRLAKLGGFKWDENDEAIKGFRKRDALIARLENSSAETSGECHGLDNAGQVFFYEQDHYYLSNFSAFETHYNGFDFKTSEHAYQWAKFYGHNAVCAIAVKESASAHEAFKEAERLRDRRRPDWDAVKVDVMRDILRAKAMQHEYVARKLEATGDRELIENSWRDDFWGWGPNRDGLNMLGKLWMEVRSERRAVKTAAPRCICAPGSTRADCPQCGDPAALTAAARPPISNNPPGRD